MAFDKLFTKVSLWIFLHYTLCHPHIQKYPTNKISQKKNIDIDVFGDFDVANSKDNSETDYGHHGDSGGESKGHEFMMDVGAIGEERTLVVTDAAEEDAHDVEAWNEHGGEG